MAVSSGRTPRLRASSGAAARPARLAARLLVATLAAVLLIAGVSLLPRPALAEAPALAEGSAAALAAAMAEASPPHWTLSDAAGQRWGLVLFEQPDPAYPAGPRLRLNALEPGQRIDHQRPLQVDDGAAQQWQLPNRSEELVAAGETALPPGAAQFDAAGLVPPPSDRRPLRLLVPMADGGNDASLMLGADPTQQLARRAAEL
ncbi:DUF3122 domain-containing protein [Synechococcus sp. ATX 2A4]|uniref:DUF3122 domain-containing protein n=1 Tax=Synechococcus sp. ATX 2A4 TaxID=2823727 RepID=UPI0020CE512D|nr:DUF3122 domain-containing protein [Synechococcus sp. ATX 2A4]MCP9883511.1 DUF3122 domain-containing protein [Synechococcus sp. ATX 2A4]